MAMNFWVDIIDLGNMLNRKFKLFLPWVILGLLSLTCVILYLNLYQGEYYSTRLMVSFKGQAGDNNALVVEMKRQNVLP